MSLIIQDYSGFVLTALVGLKLSGFDYNKILKLQSLFPMFKSHFNDGQPLDGQCLYCSLILFSCISQDTFSYYLFFSGL